jgi:hypothetical protein
MLDLGPLADRMPMHHDEGTGVIGTT